MKDIYWIQKEILPTGHGLYALYKNYVLLWKDQPDLVMCRQVGVNADREILVKSVEFMGGELVED